MSAQDVEIVQTETVVCDGTKDSGGHPKVYLHMKAATHDVRCPYCGKLFKLDTKAKAASH